MRAVSITAMGAVTPFGAGPEALWSGLIRGEGRVMPGESPESGLPVVAALVPAETLGQGEDRALAMARLAADQLQASPAWARVDPARLGVFVGTTQGAIGTWSRHQRRLSEDAAGEAPPWPWLADPARLVARITGARGPVECPSMACVSGTAALGLAMNWIRAAQPGRPRWAVAGGVDAFSDFVHAGFKALKAVDPRRPLPFDRRRRGLGAGEGAGLLLLDGAEVAGAPRLLGWGLGGDANHLTGPHPEGLGLSRAVREALSDAGLAPTELDHVNAHGTATVYNDQMESRALHHALGSEAASSVPVNSIKGALGHSMAAAGAVEALVSAMVLERGLIPPTVGLEQPDPEIHLDLVHGQAREGVVRRVLSTSAGFGGLNAALVLGAP